MIRLHARAGKTDRPAWIVARTGIDCCAMVQISAKLSVGADASQVRASTSGRDALRSRVADRGGRPWVPSSGSACSIKPLASQCHFGGPKSPCRMVTSPLFSGRGCSRRRGADLAGRQRTPGSILTLGERRLWCGGMSLPRVAGGFGERSLPDPTDKWRGWPNPAVREALVATLTVED
jgi:hypothetical protein